MLLNGSLGKTLLIPTPGHIAPAPGAPAPELDDNARPLSLPPLNLIASLRVRQDEENGDADARPSLPPQRRVTKQIMQEWGRRNCSPQSAYRTHA